ncbi:putative protein phosphatase DevT [Helianthus annuus]|uniref:Putative calcineurin-like metallo-phosphoesterase superfamily protein n=2 Tax=Helianthus annuus TaxID=4232 RepID=A0A251TQP4_HELAN|nr:uncharacterized protein LOC110886651 isoform X1 [Helianthus annuus]KAF5788186.1 putative protein phosphatase DevT [Helianthus annuus]KAJ0515261.1 putative protein phosphatase DevT [Helianthus annuus]KAJ0531453.1 putative protein phosphatase DevT [Helianthus annuus]KAJ0698296.1 putative protein phosphatase DevT [Helianthus annuus]KAJ0881376.1 putative protein phosphatase DevT [Helianthus annuus]
MFPGALSHAPNPTVFFRSSTVTPSSSTSFKCNYSIRLSMASSVRIVVVGDVHDDWDLPEDSKALELLQPDLVLFTGDFGNENVELVKSIAALKMAKAAILGNHDAWNTQNFSEKRKDAVQLQLESFGEEHVGYKRLDFHPLKLSVVGGRPFSCGGERLFRKQLLAKRYGVNNMNESAKRISDAALGTPKNHSIILLAHNGPTGLGSNLNDICGRDWVREGGDHGDPDLALAIAQLKGNTKHSVPLVVFGHMHKELAFGNGPRKMIVVGDDNTIYLNGAIVPRVKRFHDNPLTENPKHTLRAFTLIDSKEGKLEKIAETWVSVIGDNTSVEEEHILFSSNMLNTSNV